MDNRQAVSEADFVFLGFKPPDLEEVAEQVHACS